jgi:hypothetical protein
MLKHLIDPHGQIHPFKIEEKYKKKLSQKSKIDEK